MTVKSGDFLYVPISETTVAMSYGAIYVDGDARLKIPSPLPDGVDASMFERWTSPEMRVVWIAEFLEGICGAPIDLLNVAGLIEASGGEKLDISKQGVPLYVPKFEMDRVRLIPGVRWDRKIRRYVADQSADFMLIYPYLTPGMRAIWMADRNLDMEIETLTKTRALRYQIEGTEGGDRQELQRVPEERKPSKVNQGSEDKPW